MNLETIIKEYENKIVLNKILKGIIGIYFGRAELLKVRSSIEVARGGALLVEGEIRPGDCA